MRKATIGRSKVGPRLRRSGRFTSCTADLFTCRRLDSLSRYYNDKTFSMCGRTVGVHKGLTKINLFDDKRFLVFCKYCSSPQGQSRGDRIGSVGWQTWDLDEKYRDRLKSSATEWHT